ncbi:MAG: bifunctional phosphoribosyl-AMP cyclohydrolase/phosphoribosyl-ATP diphosphatase HisIE, partial [Clostridiales bacterium]|nr:bifunctional phosphoribosyl-AMP cyclohydrolase/phosphoribosyl-ATP diphosphatase HisIE [Clostridiales bacterium]
MAVKKIIPYINAENELEESVVKGAIAYERNGADELFIYNYSSEEIEREEFLLTVKHVVKAVDIPVIIGCYVKRFEDVKKAFYTGAVRVVIPYAKLADETVIKEASDRFGKDKIVVEFDEGAVKNEGALSDERILPKFKELGATAVLLKHVYMSENVLNKIANACLPIYIRDSLLRNDMETLIGLDNVLGVATNYYENKDIYKIKRMLKEAGIATDTFESEIPFSEFKLDEHGLIPCVVQDCKTNEVLMVAYMNAESYQKTIETGKMTYFSRSRQELWLKGETSGHFQYVRSLSLDCDKDTILAKVQQIGAACHTGNHSCFFRELVRKDLEDMSPTTVFNEVFGVILDRKEHPKEGSYTNYLFDKGIDKILKKCGEEATEIVIAAKNPNAEELKYEIADFLYHMMVLMA